MSANSPALNKSESFAIRAQIATLTAAFLGWMFDGFELGIGPVAIRSALIDLLGYTSGKVDDGVVGSWNGWITFSFLMGAALGGLIFGWLGDKIGRVKAMTISILFYSLFTGTAYFSQAPWHLCAFRFLGALGMGGEWALGVALVMEAWPAKHRPLLAGIIGAAANVGFLLIGVIAMLFPVTPQSWRWVMLLGATPAVLTFLISLFVPESEKWKDAVKTAPTVSPIREVFGQQLFKKTALAIVLASVALIGTWGSVQWIPLWIEKNVKVTFDSKDLSVEQIKQKEQSMRAQAKASAHTISSLGAIVGCLAGALFGGWMGRRITYFGLCLVSLLLCAYLFRFHSTYDGTMMLLIFLVGGASASFYGWLPLYLPELFPTRVRATGQGLSFNFGRIVAAFGAIGSGALVAMYDGDYGKMCATVTLVYLAGMVLVWLGPETKGKPLPD